jgi:hypothetical protein
MELDEAVETLSGNASQYGRYAQERREPSCADAEFDVSVACTIASFSFEGARLQFRETFGHLTLVDHA